MWPLILIAGAAYYWYIVRPNLAAAHAAAAPSASPMIAPLMTQGQIYAFGANSTLDEATFQSELANVGAVLQGGVLTPQPGVYTGLFEWQGAPNEPTEHLPGITWAVIEPVGAPQPAIPAIPQTTVSGDVYY